MAAPSDAQRIALLTGYTVISLYYAAALYVAWAQPGSKRFGLLRPRWRGGVRASRFGVTAQAAFAFSLSAFGASKLLQLSLPALEAVFWVSLVFCLAGWLVDFAADGD
ncbi:hypothetical protein GCM10007167_24160 [Vulcaniibacterium thermophilum]|uniref:Uncharacterized protein n=1 Tax=Vulcaniibacterium thermophilum TaxID=1169913 RepID=A0A918Z8J5_9GAMM|nr:hypothetical protein GCM10007167_24160 [Vulcaniibacterium thermophilum]